MLPELLERIYASGEVEDGAGERLTSQLARAGVETTGLVLTADRSTAIKTRILATHASAHPQQVARIGWTTSSAISSTCPAWRPAPSRP